MLLNFYTCTFNTCRGCRASGEAMPSCLSAGKRIALSVQRVKSAGDGFKRFRQGFKYFDPVWVAQTENHRVHASLA